MFIVSYYDALGQAHNKELPAWQQAVGFASRKATRPQACPVIIVSEDGHVLWQVNK